MDNYKLKLKIGANEFEAEGAPEVVKEQFREFKELLIEAAKLSADLGTTFSAQPVPFVAPPGTAPEPASPPVGSVDQMLDRIMRIEHRVVSLTITARSLDEAVLLIVYGQKVLRANDAVTGSEVMSGLTMSGVRVARADKLLVKAGELGDLIVIGIGRAKRYRLTNAGMNKARQIAADLIATVA